MTIKSAYCSGHITASTMGLRFEEFQRLPHQVSDRITFQAIVVNPGTAQSV